MLRFPALALVVVVALSGCDRYADPQSIGPGAAPPTGTPAVVGSMYVKGNPVLSVEAPVQFRAQQVQGAARYGWTMRGQGAASITSLDGTRIVAVTGVDLGPGVIRAEAYDDQNRLIAVGTREVVVE